MRFAHVLRTLSADVLVAAALTLATLAAASAGARPDTTPGPSYVAVLDDGQSKGLPPSPGPTNPNAPGTY
jgi:hypothetical protein